VAASLDRRADVIDGRLPILHVERRRLDDNPQLGLRLPQLLDHHE
jgi:hypothetical protein